MLQNQIRTTTKPRQNQTRTTYHAKGNPSPQPTKSKKLSYKKEDVIRILRKVKRALDHEWTDSAHLVIGPAAEVLRGILETCESVQLYLTPIGERTVCDNLLPWKKRLEHSYFELELKMRNIPKTVQIHDLQDKDYCLIYSELLPPINTDAYVFRETGVCIPTTPTNLSFWDQLNLGRLQERNILETVVSAHLSGELEEEDYQLFGDIFRWRNNGGLIDDDYEQIVSKINKRKDSDKWLDAMDA